MGRCLPGFSSCYTDFPHQTIVKTGILLLDTTTCDLGSFKRCASGTFFSCSPMSMLMCHRCHKSSYVLLVLAGHRVSSQPVYLLFNIAINLHTHLLSGPLRPFPSSVPPSAPHSCSGPPQRPPRACPPLGSLLLLFQSQADCLHLVRLVPCPASRPHGYLLFSYPLCVLYFCPPSPSPVFPSFQGPLQLCDRHPINFVSLPPVPT